MPITKREAHYGSPKELINYILDEKHNGEKVGQISSINCNPETALLEFKDIQRKYQMKGNRVAYHIIQSFSPKDNITEEQANEIGKRLCEELYPDFQCIIATHVDKGHIHNHICLSAISINGRKLEDRLANEKEGLYGLSDTSDKIAAEYGCFILPKKTYMKSKTKDYYHQYKEQSWKEKIKEDIEGILPKCDSLDEFLDELSIAGYEVKRGKNISVKCLGMERFARLSTIHNSLSINNLYKYFKNKEDIYMAVVESELERLSDMMESVVQKDMPPDEKLIEMVYNQLDAVKEVVYRNGTLRAYFFRDIWKFEQVRKRFYVKEIQLFKQVLQEGVEKGIFQIDDIDLIAELLHYCLKGVEVPYIRGHIGAHLDAATRKRYVADIIYGALHKSKNTYQ